MVSVGVTSITPVLAPGPVVVVDAGSVTEDTLVDGCAVVVEESFAIVEVGVDAETAVDDPSASVLVSVSDVGVDVRSGRQNCTPAMSGVVASVLGSPTLEKRDA